MMFKERVWPIFWLLVVSVMLGGALYFSAPAKAAPNVGCETVGWGLNIFGNWTQRRTICDSPRRADGSWERFRMIWTPAGYVPRSSYCGRYSCSSSGGYYREETLQGKETYVVFDSNVLSDEPGWLPPGTDNVMVR